MNKSSYKRTAIVTGGGKNIGRCISRELLAAGINVVIAEIDGAAGKKTARDYGNPGNIIFSKCDVSNETDIKNTIALAMNKFGRIDILVNNAAVMEVKRLEKLTIGGWNKVINVNLTGAFLFSKHSARYLKKTRGSIINISSTRALMSEPDTFAYSATKSAILGLTHSLAVSLGPEIRVNCISPGWINNVNWENSEKAGKNLTKTDNKQHPSGRAGTPEDIARLVLFLASPENSFITGANFVVDGGMTRKMVYI